MPSSDDVDVTDAISHVVLGRCGCVPHSTDLPSLSSCGLPTPQWVASWERVKGCFPGGCDVCGVWVGIEEGEKRVTEKSVREIVKDLMDKTDLPVRVGSVHLNCMYCCVVLLQKLMGDRRVLVAAIPVSTDRPDSLQVYEVDEVVLLREVTVAEVGDYLSSHTHLLRVTSSLPAHINPHHATRGTLVQ